MLILKANELDKAAELLKKDGVVAFPTETVFGLGIKATSNENKEKLMAIKNRREDKPFTLMFSNINQIINYVDLNELSKKIIKEFMPGELTLIVKSKDGIEEYLDNGTGYIGIRMPNSKLILDLIDKVKDPLFVPSCNKRDQKPCENVEEINNVFGNEIDACIEGNIKGGVPSTIIKIENNDLILLRQGNIKLEDIKRRINL